LTVTLLPDAAGLERVTVKVTVRAFSLTVGSSIERKRTGLQFSWYVPWAPAKPSIPIRYVWPPPALNWTRLCAA
jgi:hypothetical protein